MPTKIVIIKLNISKVFERKCFTWPVLCLPLTAIVILDFHLNSGYNYFSKTVTIFTDEKKKFPPNFTVHKRPQKLFF